MRWQNLLYFKHAMLAVVFFVGSQRQCAGCESHPNLLKNDIRCLSSSKWESIKSVSIRTLFFLDLLEDIGFNPMIFWHGLPKIREKGRINQQESDSCVLWKHLTEIITSMTSFPMNTFKRLIIITQTFLCNFFSLRQIWWRKHLLFFDVFKGWQINECEWEIGK